MSELKIDSTSLREPHIKFKLKNCAVNLNISCVMKNVLLMHAGMHGMAL